MQINVNSTNAQNGKNRSAIFTILRHLRHAKRGASGYFKEVMAALIAAITSSIFKTIRC